MILRCLDDETRREIEKMPDELIWMLGFDVEFFENMRRKIGQVAGDDDARARLDRGCQYVTIVGVRECESGNKVLIAPNQRGRCGLVHELSRAFEFISRQVGPVRQKIPDPLLMHICGPPRTKYAGQCEVHEEIAQLGRVQNVRVIEDDECGHNLDSDLLVVCGELGESGPALGIGRALICHQGLKPDSAVGSNFAVFDFAFVQELNE